MIVGRLSLLFSQRWVEFLGWLAGLRSMKRGGGRWWNCPLSFHSWGFFPFACVPRKLAEIRSSVVFCLCIKNRRVGGGALISPTWWTKVEFLSPGLLERRVLFFRWASFTRFFFFCSSTTWSGKAGVGFSRLSLGVSMKKEAGVTDNSLFRSGGKKNQNLACSLAGAESRNSCFYCSWVWAYHFPLPTQRALHLILSGNSHCNCRAGQREGWFY